MNSIRINIDGLEDNETQDRVKDQLEGMTGIVKVNFSTGQNYVDIGYNEQISIPEINNHLQNNGYKVTDVIQW